MAERLFEYVLVHTWKEEDEEFNELIDNGHLFAKDQKDVEIEVYRSDVALNYEVNELKVLVRPF